MAVERDCNTCIHHYQGLRLLKPECGDCLRRTRENGEDLPNWTPFMDSYMAAIEERHPEKTFEELDELYGTGMPYSSIEGKQSRKESLIEASLNTLSGFLVSYFVWLLLVELLNKWL